MAAYAWGGPGITNGIQVNGELRTNGIDSLDPEMRGFVDRLDEVIEASTDKLPPILYRTVADPSIYKQFADLEVGDTIRDDAYLSTSADPDILEGFVQGDYHERVDFRINPKGAKGIDVDAHTGEFDYKQKEFLLPRGTALRVRSKTKGPGGQTVLYVDVVPDGAPSAPDAPGVATAADSVVPGIVGPRIGDVVQTPNGSLGRVVKLREDGWVYLRGPHHLEPYDVQYYSKGAYDPSVLSVAVPGSAAPLKDRVRLAKTSIGEFGGSMDADIARSVIKQEVGAYPDEVKQAIVRYATGRADSPLMDTEDMTASIINQALRKGHSGHPDIPALDSAAELGPGFPGGRNGEGLAFRVLPASVLEGLDRGDTFSDPAFVSTTVDRAQLKGPRDNQASAGLNPVVVSILIPDGFPGFSTTAGYVGSYHDTEHMLKTGVLRQGEWVLPRGTRFKVLSKGKNNWIVEALPPGPAPTAKPSAEESGIVPSGLVPPAKPGLVVPGFPGPAPSPGARVYAHPQGARIYVNPDGSMEAYGATGKPKKTSATPEKLAKGHGAWTEIVPDAPAATLVGNNPSAPVAPLHAVEPEVKSVKIAGPKRIPMEFKEASVAQIDEYIDDPDFFFQQKVDGIRGQLVLAPGAKPWFRSKSGDRLVNPTATAITDPLIKALGEGLPEGTPQVTIDGELLDGKWYIFDMVVDGQDLPWEQRMAQAEGWVDSVRAQGLTRVVSLPTARTPEQKRALFESIKAGGGEGVMVKRRGAKYKFGQRTDEILKAKVTSTADVVVMETNAGGKEAAVVGVFRNGKLERVANVPTQGKFAMKPGDVIEVEYLYANPDSGLLTQARVKKPRPDKSPTMVTDSQLRFVDKKVLDASALTPGSPGETPSGPDEAPPVPTPALGAVGGMKAYDEAAMKIDDLGLDAPDAKRLRTVARGKSLTLNETQREELGVLRRTAYSKIGERLGFTQEQVDEAIDAEDDLIASWIMIGPEAGTATHAARFQEMFGAIRKLRDGEQPSTPVERGMAMQRAYTQMVMRERGEENASLIRIVTGPQAEYISGVISAGGAPKIGTNPVSSWAVPAGAPSIKKWVKGNDHVVQVSVDVPADRVWLSLWADERFRTPELQAKGEYVIDDLGGFPDAQFEILEQPTHYAPGGGAHKTRASVALASAYPDLTDAEYRAASLLGQRRFTMVDADGWPEDDPQAVLAGGLDRDLLRTQAKLRSLTSPEDPAALIEAFRRSGVDPDQVRRLLQAGGEYQSRLTGFSPEEYEKTWGKPFKGWEGGTKLVQDAQAVFRDILAEDPTVADRLEAALATGSYYEPDVMAHMPRPSVRIPEGGSVYEIKTQYGTTRFIRVDSPGAGPVFYDEWGGLVAPPSGYNLSDMVEVDVTPGTTPWAERHQGLLDQWAKEV